MTESVQTRVRWHRRRGVPVLILTVLLAAAGIGSLVQQARYRRVDIGLQIVDAAGRAEIVPGGEADRAGIRTGDRIIAIGGQPVRGAFDWSAPLGSAKAAERSGTLDVELLRGGAPIRFQVPYTTQPGTGPWVFYLALVGFFFLATAALAEFRGGRSSLGGLYFAFTAAIFMVLALSDTPAGSWFDGLLFVADRIGRLTFGPLFLLLALSVARSGAGRLRRFVRIGLVGLVGFVPGALAAANLAILAAASRGRLRDPLALWALKDRIELLVAGAFILTGLVVLQRALAWESVSYRTYVLRWAFWGAVAGFGPFTVGYLIPKGLGLPIPAWTELTALPLVALPLALSIVLFRLRPGDLELYLRRALAYVSDAFLTLAVFEASLLLLERAGGEIFDLTAWMRAGLSALVAAFAYPGIHALTRQTIDRIVYGGRSSFRRTLLSFGRDLNAELSLDALVTKLQERTRESLDLESSFLLVRFDREGMLRTVGGTTDLALPVDSPLIARIGEVSYLLLEDILHAPGAERLGPLRDHGILYLFPMKVEGEVRGILATGPRRGGDSLTTEDVELLVALCGHAAIALESARLFAALREKVEEIESLRRYNENILESSRVGILVVDGEGRIRAMNRALVDMYGADRQEAIGRELGAVFPLPLVRRLAQSAEPPETSDGIRRLYRYPLTNVRGRRLIVNLSISELEAGDGEEPGRVITFDDVTDRARMEEQLLRQDRLASIGLLAAGVAHEVNTPLTGISSYAQILMNELPPGDPRLEVLKKIERQTFRASSIIHSLLNFTRDGAGSVELIRVHDLIEESLSLFEPQLRGRNITIEKEIEEGIPPVLGERGKLQQVMLNLLMNARDAIEGQGKIRLQARRVGGRLALEVRDDGSGIAEEDLAKVFDPFFTTKPRGRGTGLGLSLSYTIVQEHRGEISVESRPGQGTTFTVDLPFEGRGAANA